MDRLMMFLDFMAMAWGALLGLIGVLSLFTGEPREDGILGGLILLVIGPGVALAWLATGYLTP